MKDNTSCIHIAEYFDEMSIHEDISATAERVGVQNFPGKLTAKFFFLVKFGSQVESEGRAFFDKVSFGNTFN